MSALPWTEPTGWPDDAVRDRLIGDWHLYQRRGGHRTSTDDVVTAWFAKHRAARPERYLDLGCGVGSVLLMCAHALRPDECVGVEAQPQSVVLARRTVSELPDAPAITIVEHDLREVELEPTFSLITGSPPYFPLNAGVLPDDSQRRACRFEARGGVEVYCAAAARGLTEDGRFILVFQTTWNARVEEAAAAANLHITSRVDFKMRVDRDAPFLSVFEMRRAPEELATQTIAVRNVNGEFTRDFQTLRSELGV